MSKVTTKQFLGDDVIQLKTTDINLECIPENIHGGRIPEEGRLVRCPIGRMMAVGVVTDILSKQFSITSYDGMRRIAFYSDKWEYIE